MKFKKAIPVILSVSLVGCAIHQTVKPVTMLEEKQVCIIENPAVKNGFLESYTRALSNKGYRVRNLPTNASLNDCKITSTYTANWRWDLAMYMAFAEIKVYSGGRVIGEAKYDSLRGGANMGKFISAEKKITELTNQLFPGGAGN
jgi:Egg lysin (Sperm-lysin)